MQEVCRGSCILSKFYIKPQRSVECGESRSCCILSKFYIKPQRPGRTVKRQIVVSYRNSTSNHNKDRGCFLYFGLYLIEILHQTTTVPCGTRHGVMLYLIEILHQTTTLAVVRIPVLRLYLIEILHQTTTVPERGGRKVLLYLIEILHQTTTTRTHSKESK